MWAAQYFKFKQPRTWLTSGSMGTMGYGLPAAIGAAASAPDRIVIDIDGDGSIRMNLGEMETVTTYNLPVKVLLLNNLGDGMVRAVAEAVFENRFSGTDKALHKKDFVKAAEADGFNSQSGSARSRPEDTLKDFIDHKGPAFLEVMIDPNAFVWPMVGPRQGLQGDDRGGLHQAPHDPGSRQGGAREGRPLLTATPPASAAVQGNNFTRQASLPAAGFPPAAVLQPTYRRS
jgi:acetolactate synthase-1/2/3 large subunit